MAFCGNCGFELPEGMKFCPNCGTAIFDPTGMSVSSDGGLEDNYSTIEDGNLVSQLNSQADSRKMQGESDLSRENQNEDTFHLQLY